MRSLCALKLTPAVSDAKCGWSIALLGGALAVTNRVVVDLCTGKVREGGELWETGKEEEMC